MGSTILGHNLMRLPWLLWVSLAVSQKFFVSSLHIFFSFTSELTRDGLIGGGCVKLQNFYDSDR